MRFSKYNETSYKFGIPYNQEERIKLRIKSDNIIKQNKSKTKVKKPQNKSDIFLANLKKHLQKQERKAKSDAFKKARQFVKDMKKEEYRYKDMQNPKYKRFNKYRSHFFKDHILLRSHEGLTVGTAWALLRKCWIGFKRNYRIGNDEGMVHYGTGVQKYLYLLEELPMDFSEIGLKPFKDFY